MTYRTRDPLEVPHRPQADVQIELLPQRARVPYNYALLLQTLERRDEAEALLKSAYELDARDADIVYALVVFYTQDEDWQAALQYARELQVLEPVNPGVAQLIEQLEQAQSAVAAPG